MRVLIAVGIFPPDIGGPATYVSQMATALAKRGHSITVVTLSDYVPYDPQDQTPNFQHPTPNTQHPFRVVRLPRKTFKPWRWLRTVITLIRLGRSADVLFVNGLAMEAVIANSLLGIPMVQKVVGDLAWERAMNRGWVKEGFEDFQKKRYGPKVEALKALRGWWTRQADTVIVPSRYLAIWVVGWGVPRERIRVIYNAVDPLNGIRPAEIPLQAPLKVVTVGRLVTWKRIDGILAAIARVADAGLIVIGDGPQRIQLEEQVRSLKMADRVYFAGARNKEETLSMMAGCDFFVLNSSYEGFPHVVLEAMSIGLPVVAKNSGGTPEIVEDGRNGRLIESSDSGALSEVLSALLCNPDQRRQIAEGGRRTAARFTLDRMVQETEQALTLVAGKS